MPVGSRGDIIRAYRQLYRQSLRAVQYAKPARYQCTQRLRYAFDSSTPDIFDQEAIDRTLEFLEGAAREKGLEHKIIKSLAHIWYHQDQALRHRAFRYPTIAAHETAAFFGQCINHTIENLNRTMGILLPAKPFLLSPPSRNR